MTCQDVFPSYPQTFPLLILLCILMPLLWLKILSTFRNQETLGGSMHSTKLIICVLLCLSLSDPLQRDWSDRRDRTWGACKYSLIFNKHFESPLCTTIWEYTSLPLRNLPTERGTNATRKPPVAFLCIHGMCGDIRDFIQTGRTQRKWGCGDLF